MACPMVSIKKGNTNQNTETRIESDLTNRITKIGVKIRREIIKANIGIRTRINTDIAPVPLKTKKSIIAAIIRIRIERVPRLARSTKVAVHPAKIKKRIRTRAGTRNIITNRARAPKTKTGKIRRKVYKTLN